jgi:hypothetical protein
MPLDASQIIIAATERKAEQIDEPLLASGQMPAQAQQPLTMLAKSIQPNGHRPTIRPKDLITFEENISTVAVFGGIAAK